MLKRFVLIAICAVLLGTALVTAQQAPPPPQPEPRPVAQPTQAPPPPPPRSFGQPVTVRVDLTVSDQAGTAAPVRKTTTLLAADGERASVRSTYRVPGLATSAQFNVDARPILAQDKIRVDLIIFYDAGTPPQTGGDSKDGSTTSIQESMGVVVENGKPLVLSESPDPRSNRKVTVEVKATILK